MATQAAVIADTIAGMKRAISRYNDSSDSGETIDRSTNRGNKLKRKARHVHERQLDRPNGPKVYKKRIEHAGYYRDVISQNPNRYDVDGNRLEDDEDDEEADAAAAEANPYSGVVLHELLAPLTSAAHLPDHPSLSVPYLTPILSNMTQEACKMLQRERNTIRGAKQLLTKLRGDETWIPCGSLDSDTDDIIFDTSKVLEECIRSCPSRKIADKEDDITLSDTTLLPLDDTVGTSPKADRLAGLDTEDEAGSAFPRAKTDGHRLVDEPDIPKSLLNASDHMKGSQGIEIAPVDGDDGTTVRQDFEASRDTSGAHPALPEVHETSSLGANSLLNDTTQAVSAESIALNGVNGAVAGASADLIDGDRTSTTDGALNFDKKSNLPSVVTLTGLGGLLTDANEVIPMMDIEGSQAISDGLQPIAHRMTTRAQAQAVSDNTTSSRARSVSVASSSIPSIHPLFLMPSGACPDRDFGLSPDEAEATRRILMSFIQKQEEVCRGTEKLYNGLLKMERMKKNVWDSCKAEGHIGEMSDGEDWYDKEKWGLEEDLRKGHDEEEDDVGTQHKKTRQRRA